MSSMARTWIIVAFAALACAARAGHYAVTYSGGGPVTIVGPSGGSWSSPYATTANGRGGGGVSQDPPGPGGMSGMAGPGSVVCQGAITATLTWVPDAGEPPQKSVVIFESAQASWSGTSGSADNGLGDPPVGDGESGHSGGGRYTLKNNPGASFSLPPVSPSANAGCTPNNAIGILAAGASVIYSVETAPLVLTLEGTAHTSGNSEIGSLESPNAVMIGGRVRGGISCDLATLTDWNWTVPGDPFASFQLSGYLHNSNPPGPAYTGGQRINLAPGTLQLQQPTWVWPGNYSPYNTRTVSCSVKVTVYDGGTVDLGTGSAELTAYVFAPYNDVEQTESAHSDSYEGSPITHVVSRSAGGPTAVWFEGATGTPEFARLPGDPGGWNFGQTLALDRHVYDSFGWVLHDWVCPRWHLDNTFPYGAGIPPGLPSGAANPNAYNFRNGTQWDADVASGTATVHFTVDTPREYIYPASFFDIDDEYRMHQMYMPPNHGLGVEYVPLKRWDWTWTSAGSVASGSWAPNPPGTVSPSAPVNFPPHPIWTDHETNQ